MIAQEKREAGNGSNGNGNNNGNGNGPYTTRRELLGDAETSNYKPYSTTFFKRPRDLPPFTFRTIDAMLLDPTVRLGLAARLAPIMGAEFCYKQNDQWVPGVMANSPIVAAFVMRQFKKIWSQIHVIASNQIWGWSGAEVTFELRDTGTVEINELLPRAASDVKVLVEDSKAVGVQFERIGQAGNGKVQVRFPRSIFAAYQPDAGQWYGSSALLGCYSPWADKCFEGGAVDVRRLFMHKDAYGGMDIAYPDGRNYEIEGKGVVTSRDIADEIVQQALSGSVTVRPSGNHPDGTPLWDVKRATTPGNPAHILQYPKDLDVEILRGLEVPDDILTAEASGAWAGKTVPMMAFYMSLDRWLAELVKSVCSIVKPLVALNFGPKAWFQVETKPLAEQMLEQQAKMGAGAQSQGAGSGAGANKSGEGEQYSQQPGQAATGTSDQSNDKTIEQKRLQAQIIELEKKLRGFDQQQTPQQRMSADVGRGVLSACELVKAARTLMSSEITEDKSVSKFSSTQFDLPFEIASRMLAMASRIEVSDLAKDGIEDQPHVTVKYGLHTEDPEEVGEKIRRSSPVAILFGSTSVFESPEYDVVKIEIEGNGIRDLNKILSELPHTDTHSSYLPHATIAYVKPGLGRFYAEKLGDLKGEVCVFNRLIFSNKSREHYSLPLLGTSVRFSVDDSGRAHAPSGSENGGQFVSKDGGSGGDSGSGTALKQNDLKQKGHDKKLERATQKRLVRQSMAPEITKIKRDAEDLSIEQWADIANSVWSFDPGDDLEIERSHVDELASIMFHQSGKNSEYVDSLSKRLGSLTDDDENEAYDLADSAIEDAISKAAQSQAEKWAKNLSVDSETMEKMNDAGRAHADRGGDAESYTQLVSDLTKIDPKRPWLALYASYFDTQDYSDDGVETMSLVSRVRGAAKTIRRKLNGKK